MIYEIKAVSRVNWEEKFVKIILCNNCSLLFIYTIYAFELYYI